MRVALFILLFANIAFFAWGTWIDTPVRAAPSPEAKGARPLMLAAEADAKAATVAGGVEAAARAAVSAIHCVSVGPFESQELAESAQTQLRARGYEPRERTEEGERMDGYWVYIGNLKSDLEEARIMRSLMQAQLSDARIMPISSEGRRISVGIFSERVRAERRARALERLGLEPQIGERKVKNSLYWLDLDLRGGQAPPSTDGLLPSDGDAAPVQVASCPAPASDTVSSAPN